MLQILVYGDAETDFLDIDESVQLSMESLTDLFDEDLSTGDFSVPIDIAWTDKNKRLFGFSERLENFSTRKREWKIDVYDNMFPELVASKLTILEKNGLFSYTRGKFSATVSGTKGLFGTLIRNKKLADLVLGGTITWTSIESRAFAEEVMKGLRPQYNYFGFAPIGWDGFFLTDRPDYDNEFLAKTTVNNVIAGGGTWVFGRPQIADPTLATDYTMAEHRDYRTIPFLKTKFVLKKIFEEHGFTIGGAFYNDTAFDDEYIFNNYSIEKYKYLDDYQDYNRSIDPRNHVPDIYIKDFLKNLFTSFNLFPVFTGSSTVTLFYRKDYFTQKKVFNIDAICAREFQSSYENNETKSGFTINYAWDSNDQYYGDRVKDLSDKILAATVLTRDDLDDIASGLTTDHIAYVLDENMYYQVADGSTTPMKWDAFAEGLNEYKSGDGENNVDLGLSTLCQWVEFNTVTGLWERRNYLGTRQPGSYLGNKQTRVINGFGFRIFNITMKNIGGTVIPVSFNHNLRTSVSSVEVIDDSYSESNADGSSSAALSSTSAVGWGQSFQSSGGVLSKAVFHLTCSVTSGPVVVKIYASGTDLSGNYIPTGAALAASDSRDASSIAGVFTLEEFVFSGTNRITLLAGAIYVVTVEFSGGDVSIGQSVEVDIDTVNKTHSGNPSYKPAGGGAWTGTTGSDTPFYVYVISTSLDKEDYSLALNGDDGIVNIFHNTWQQLKTKLEIVKTELMMNEQVRKQIADATVLEKDNVQYVLYKTEPQIPKKKTLVVYIAPL